MQPAKSSHAKLTRPRLHHAVARQRLFRKLDEACEQYAALCVVGPPGAGKTTLVASWADARGRKGVWYQLDNGDADLATFFFYLGEAARPYLRRGHRPLPALTPEYLHDIEGFSRRFFRDLFALLPHGACVVLDNYQEVSADQRFHELVADAVAEVPRGCAMVVVSRRDPPNCYARLVANDNVAFVDWADLRLTLRETHAIVDGRGASLSVGEVEQLHTESGGWAAGLTLLLEGRRRSLADPPAPLAERDVLFGYFAAQIFARVSEPIQRFLVTTALLPQVPVSIARALTGESTASEILEDLYRRHLFTHRRSGAQPIYWYHALFRDYLLNQGERLLGADGWRDYQRRAGRLLEAADSFDEAFSLYRATGDWDAIARISERHAEKLIAHGRGSTLRDWLGVLPASSLERNPWLRFWLGTSLIPVDAASGRAELELAYEQFLEVGHHDGQALAAAGVLESHHFEWSDFTAMPAWVERLGPLIERGLFVGAPERELQIHSTMLMGIYYSAPRHPMLMRCLNRVFEMLDERLEHDQKVKAGTFLLAYCNVSGELQRGAAVVQRVSPLLDTPTITPLNALWWNLRLGHFHTMVGALQEAAASLAKAREIARTHGLSSLRSAALLLRSYETNLACLLGDRKSARQLTIEIKTLADPLRPLDAMHAMHNPVYVATLEGDAEAMCSRATGGYAAARSAGLCYTMVICLIYRAHGLAMLRRTNELHATLMEARQLVVGTCMSHFECEIAYIEAFAAMGQSDTVSASLLVRNAVRDARERRYHYPYASRISPIVPTVLGAALRDGVEIDYVHETIRRYRLRPPDKTSLSWPFPIRVRTLGAFEVVVDGVPLRFTGRTPRKPLALLKTIVALGGVDIPQSRIIDSLWPHEDGDAGKQAFGVTMVRLRKLLGTHQAVTVADETVNLDSELCWVDAHVLEAKLKSVRMSTSEAGSTDVASQLEEALALYNGTFLPGDTGEPWSIQTRLRLRDLFTAAIEELGQWYEAREQWNRAIGCYRRGLEADDLIETFYIGHMRCHLALMRVAEGLAVFRRLRQTLSVVLGVAPSPAAERLARELVDAGHRHPESLFPSSVDQR